ncbi:MAG: serine/threonine-protein kinase, partial [Planctomycetota bacterium]|nr:serine/threonine-protein kinase [Planctomycetota bacterium]
MIQNDTQICELLDRWEEAHERGEQLSAETLCAGAPHLLDEVKKQIDALSKMDARLATQVWSGGDSATQTRSETDNDTTLLLSAEFGNLQFHARGGLGAIYCATDNKLHRDVALKFIHRRFALQGESRERFLLEAEITGRLDHPGVVPVHGIGQTDGGRLFYAMRFIHGETLDSAIRAFHGISPLPGLSTGRRLELRSLLMRFVSVCNTIAYAHNRGILHRDIKPENIMLGRYGEILVVDWGLAMPIGRDQRAVESGERTLMPSSGSDSGTTSGGGAGTPAFMSPEQTRGEAMLGPVADIYSLGVTLYKILTGQTPFQGASLIDIRQQVMTGQFPPPRQRKPGTPAPLNAICLKAMALDPRQRYASALDLAADIEHWLGDE